MGWPDQLSFPFSVTWQLGLAVIAGSLVVAVIRLGKAHGRRRGPVYGRTSQLKHGFGCLLRLVAPMGVLVGVCVLVQRGAELFSQALMAWQSQWPAIADTIGKVLAILLTVQVAFSLLIGIGVVLSLHANRVWNQRRHFFYTNYFADRLKGWLLQRAWVGFGVAVLVAGTYGFMLTHESGVPPQAVDAPTPIPVRSTTTKVVIPILGIEASVVESPIVGWQWSVSGLGTNVGHLEGTPELGAHGNSVIAGHSTDEGGVPGPFFELASVEIGDYVYIEKGNAILKYEVIEIRRVEPDDVGVLYEDAGGVMLSLMTCDEFRDGAYQKRLIVIARRVG